MPYRFQCTAGEKSQPISPPPQSPPTPYPRPPISLEQPTRDIFADDRGRAPAAHPLQARVRWPPSVALEVRVFPRLARPTAALRSTAASMPGCRYPRKSDGCPPPAPPSSTAAFALPSPECKSDLRTETCSPPAAPASAPAAPATPAGSTA